MLNEDGGCMDTLIAWMISNSRLVRALAFAGVKSCTVILVLGFYLLCFVSEHWVQINPEADLAYLYPSLPTFFIPESVLGFGVYVLVIAVGLVIGSYFRCIERRFYPSSRS
jgi:hypothetical protein